jgi:hypothetical protein
MRRIIRAKYRVFVWMDTRIRSDKNITVIARDDDTSFGILQSRFHLSWSLRLGTSLEDRPRYTPTTTFETFPFPEGLTPDIPAADYASNHRARKIAQAGRRLDKLRQAWLNPPDLVRIAPEVVPGYPDRILPKNALAAAQLHERTLTNCTPRTFNGWSKPTAASMKRSLKPTDGPPIFQRKMHWENFSKSIWRGPQRTARLSRTASRRMDRAEMAKTRSSDLEFSNVSSSDDYPAFSLLTSGATASAASPASASSSPTTVCSCAPRRRIETVRVSASFLPTTRSVGTLARECSRTL